VDNSGVNARQESIGLTMPDSVAVVGCGGVGSWVAYMLALAGVPKIWLFDPDTLSDHNLNRIPLPLSTVGKRKSVAISELIRSLRPDCSVMAAGTFTPRMANQIGVDADWVVCTTDSHASRKMVRKWTKDHAIRYIEAAAEGDQGSATGEPADFATPEETQPGYASVPVWVGPCVFAAAIAVDHVLHSRKMGDRTVRLGFVKDKVGIPRFQVFDTEEGKRQREAVAKALLEMSVEATRTPVEPYAPGSENEAINAREAGDDNV
jgi:threonine dehydrogenase-like Zn-dependent dehydrogenase